MHCRVARSLGGQGQHGVHVSDTLRRLDVDGISMTQMPEGTVLNQFWHSLEKLTGIPRRSFQI